MFSEVLRQSCENLQVLFSSTYPIKVSLFCLGSTAGAVIVGSAGLALESCNKTEAEAMIVRSRSNILAIENYMKRRLDEGTTRGMKMSSARLKSGEIALRDQCPLKATLHPTCWTCDQSLLVQGGARCTMPDQVYGWNIDQQ